MFTSIAHEKGEIARLASRLAGASGAPLAWRDGCAAHASPSWRGVDATGLLVDGAPSFFAKAYHPEIALYAHLPSVFAAAEFAGSIGAGPRIMVTDEERALLVMEALAEEWRTATLADISPSGKHGEAALKARKLLHGGPQLPRTLTVFDHIEELHEAISSGKAYVPADYVQLIANSRKIAAALAAAGYDAVPSHGDGNASNLMVHKSGAVRLVDFDLAANRDPYEDLGSHLAEAFWFTSDAAVAFEHFHGVMDEQLFARTRLYAVADDLRWAMIGLLHSHRSPRKIVEYLKFAEWRMLRARMAMRHPNFERLMRLQ